MATLLSELARLITIAEKHKNAFWWTPPATAGARRAYERENTTCAISWTDGTDDYTAAYSVRCSCKNVYAAGSYTKNGRKTTLTAIRNSYKRMLKNA